MKRFLIIYFLFVGMVFGGTYGDLTYTISSNEVTITDCNESASGAIDIPATIEGLPVTSIEGFALDYFTYVL